jgi:hypothetical protein
MAFDRWPLAGVALADGDLEGAVDAWDRGDAVAAEQRL